MIKPVNSREKEENKKDFCVKTILSFVWMLTSSKERKIIIKKKKRHVYRLVRHPKLFFGFLVWVNQTETGRMCSLIISPQREKTFSSVLLLCMAKRKTSVIQSL